MQILMVKNCGCIVSVPILMSDLKFEISLYSLPLLTYLITWISQTRRYNVPKKPYIFRIF